MLRVISYKIYNYLRALRCWVGPYIKSRFYSKRFRPVLSYLFTEWNCNIDCHYCFDFDNKKKGMTLETAYKSIDYLDKVGCKVLALMGGEVLLRKNFVIKVIEYAKRKGFFVYLPTNGYLMDKDFIERAGKAGVAAINLAVDTIELKPGLPKAFLVIEDNFNYLVKQMVKYNYVVFFNINITSKNFADVKLLTEIARANRIGTDYHVCEPPLIEKDWYKHKENDFWIRPEQLEEFDELIDWLIEKEREGYPMINSVRHLTAMKKFVRHQTADWGCRAGRNGSFISVEGKFFPCFEMMNRNQDYGDVREGDKFNQTQVSQQINEMKKECQKHCLSTCFYTMSSYYDPRNMWSWVAKHARVGA